MRSGVHGEGGSADDDDSDLEVDVCADDSNDAYSEPVIAVSHRIGFCYPRSLKQSQVHLITLLIRCGFCAG